MDVDPEPDPRAVDGKRAAVPNRDAAHRDARVDDLEHAVDDALPRRAVRRLLLDGACLDDRRRRAGAADDEVVGDGVVDGVVPEIEIAAGGIIVVPGDRQRVRAGRHRDRVGLAVLARGAGIDREVRVGGAHRLAKRAIAVGVELIDGRRDRDGCGVDRARGQGEAGDDGQQAQNWGARHGSSGG